MNTQPNYPPIDRELAKTVWPAMLQQQAEQAKLSEEEFLTEIAAMVGMWQPELEHGGAVRDRETTIPSADSNERIPVLILTPVGEPGPFPCIYFTANGGKIQQTSRTGVTKEEVKWVAELGVAFISIAPRVGPKYPHPAQVEDAYAGLLWISENVKA